MFEPVLGDKGRLSDMSDKKWIVIYRKTIGNIRKWIGQNIFQYIANKIRANILWKKLESMYERKSV